MARAYRVPSHPASGRDKVCTAARMRSQQLATTSVPAGNGALSSAYAITQSQITSTTGDSPARSLASKSLGITSSGTVALDSRSSFS